MDGYNTIMYHRHVHNLNPQRFVHRAEVHPGWKCSSEPCGEPRERGGSCPGQAGIAMVVSFVYRGVRWRRNFPHDSWSVLNAGWSIYIEVWCSFSRKWSWHGVFLVASLWLHNELWMPSPGVWPLLRRTAKMLPYWPWHRRRWHCGESIGDWVVSDEEEIWTELTHGKKMKDKLSARRKTTSNYQRNKCTVNITVYESLHGRIGCLARFCDTLPQLVGWKKTLCPMWKAQSRQFWICFCDTKRLVRKLVNSSRLSCHSCFQ